MKRVQQYCNEFFYFTDEVEGLVNKIDDLVGGLVCNAVNATTGLASGVTNTLGSSKFERKPPIECFAVNELNLTTKSV